MSEQPMQDSGPVVPLPYASREEAADALWAYRLVGWYFLFVSVVAVVSVAAYIWTISHVAVMSWPSIVPTLLGNWGPTMLFAVGATGMIRARAWGCWAIVGVCGVHALLAGGAMGYQLLIASRPISAGPSFAIYSGIAGTLSGCLQAFLPWAMWRFCRRRGAWN